MKHLLIIFSLLLTSVGWSEDVDLVDLVYRDGLHYEKFSNEPYNGNSTGLYKGKFGLYKGKFKDGKQEGEWLVYYNNGQLKWERNYKDGKLEGEELYYDELGKLSRTVIYKDGKEIEIIDHW